jgi:transporter family protein
MNDEVCFMWILFAFGSAFFAGITAVLAKIGIKHTNSNIATAVRTIVVLAFAWLMVLVVGSENAIGSINGKSLLFLVLSGLATGVSWLCYFKALQLGDVNKVVPVDKTSTVLTMILAISILGESITLSLVIGMIAIGIGTYLMIQQKQDETKNVSNNKWLLFAILSAVFASLTSILGKIGISNIESNLGTAIRTAVVMVMAWVVVLATGKQNTIKNISRKDLLFICLSGIATGASWLCYYKALQDGLASVVVPIDKLSIVVTVAFSGFVLKEKPTRKAIAGLLLVVGGTLALLIK